MSSRQIAYPSHSLFEKSAHRLWAKAILYIVSDIRQRPASITQQRGAHVILSAFGQGPTTNRFDGLSSGDVSSSGTHTRVERIVQDFLYREIHREVGLLAEGISCRNIIVILFRGSFN